MKVLDTLSNTGQLKLELLLLLRVLIEGSGHPITELFQVGRRNEMLDICLDVPTDGPFPRDGSLNVDDTARVRLNLVFDSPNLGLKGPDLGEPKELDLDVLK